ncbi:hypothetical protein FISHEDRAFT_70326 [Fistulina hepatica ATCC 64428]|uniref:Uncharacterized protein n=1 Tax=Fistulina hepatica ATCC 64428 TaxID=1128425 RepID=A0A0D7AK04_9AGAR|nr:hypothetical protein FISHEDRAFT_70326 [Fistulina hepatica ATCC 64428]
MESTELSSSTPDSAAMPFHALASLPSRSDARSRGYGSGAFQPSRRMPKVVVGSVTIMHFAKSNPVLDGKCSSTILALGMSPSLSEFILFDDDPVLSFTGISPPVQLLSSPSPAPPSATVVFVEDGSFMPAVTTDGILRTVATLNILHPNSPPRAQSPPSTTPPPTVSSEASILTEDHLGQPVVNVNSSCGSPSVVAAPFPSASLTQNQAVVSTTPPPFPPWYNWYKASPVDNQYWYWYQYYNSSYSNDYRASYRYSAQAAWSTGSAPTWNYSNTASSPTLHDGTPTAMASISTGAEQASEHPKRKRTPTDHEWTETETSSLNDKQAYV